MISFARRGYWEPCAFNGLKRLLAHTLLVVPIAGCTVIARDQARLPEGPDFVSWVPRNYNTQPFPPIEGKKTSPFDPQKTLKEQDQLPRPTQTWWLEFESSELGELVETALANNYDLRVAVARIEQAERQTMISQSARYPSVDFFASREAKGPAGGVGSARTREEFSHRNIYSFGFRASYEVDLWGKIGYQVESALALARASIFNRQVVALTLTSEISTGYFQIVSLTERIQIGEKNLAVAEEVADAIAKRVEEGDSSVLELQRQQITIALIKNVIANLKLQRERAINRLAVLLGRPPSAVKIQATSLVGLKVPQVQAGLPSELLCRRPDIRRAEAQLVSASADVNVARANLLPSVTLSAEYGQGSYHLSDLLRPQSLLYNAAANLLSNVFDSERRENQLASARAKNRELLDTYANTVLSALRDVEDSLAGIRLSTMQLEALSEALNRNSRLLELSKMIYERGALEYVALLDIQRDVFQAQDAEASARFEQIRAVVDLFKAVGGGIAPENDPCVTVAQAAPATQVTPAKPQSPTTAAPAAPPAPAPAAPAAPPPPQTAPPKAESLPPPTTPAQPSLKDSAPAVRAAPTVEQDIKPAEESRSATKPAPPKLVDPRPLSQAAEPDRPLAAQPPQGVSVPADPIEPKKEQRRRRQDREQITPKAFKPGFVPLPDTPVEFNEINRGSSSSATTKPTQEDQRKAPTRRQQESQRRSTKTPPSDENERPTQAPPRVTPLINGSQ